MEQVRAVSLRAAAHDVMGSKRIWTVVALMSFFLLVSFVTAGGSLAALGVLATLPVLGYQVCVSRAVLTGAGPLPSPLRLKDIFRRGLAASVAVFVTMLPMVLGFGVLLVLASLLVRAALGAASASAATRHVVAQATGYLFAIPLMVAVYFLIVIVVSRYVAFDHLGDGLHFTDAWARFKACRTDGLRAIGYGLAGLVVLGALRYALFALAGLPSTAARSAALMLLAHGLHGIGMVVVGIDALLAVITAPWQLVIAEVLGQYSSIAYGTELGRPVEQAYRADAVS